MKTILVVHPGEGSAAEEVELLGHRVTLRTEGCGGDVRRARDLIVSACGSVASIGLDGLPLRLQLGDAETWHETARDLARSANGVSIVDGGGIRSGLERWAVGLVERAQPGLLGGRRVLMVPGLNHPGMAHALLLHARQLRYADPALFFGLPRLPFVGSPSSLPRVAAPTLAALRRLSLERLVPQPGANGAARARPLLRWAEVIAGDAATLQRLRGERLTGKTVVVESATDADLDALRARGAAVVVTLMPPLAGDDGLGRHSAAVVEALLAAIRDPTDGRPAEDAYLDMISDTSWSPAVRDLRPAEQGVNRFAFVIHPLDVGFIHRHPLFRWTRALPDSLVEAVAAHMPPMYVSTIRGGVSPTTGQRVEGQLIALGATPRQMTRRPPSFTYKRLRRAARMAQRKGARLMGLGAFTSVVGDAGVTVDKEAPIAITSGNSLTVAATLEAARQATRMMGLDDLLDGRVMVIGATGSIGSVCARMLARWCRDVVLVSIEPDRLIELKRRIGREASDTRVTVATRSDGQVGGCDLIVTATSAFGQRILDISQCKPGAVICDVARPPDINEAEAALRPDVLVIESGEVIIPGDIDLGYDIGLPPGVAYACLGETALLAMEGRFESFTIGRELRVDRVEEIFRLFERHRFRLAGLRTVGGYVSDDELVRRRELAAALRDDPERLRQVREEAARKLATIPPGAKGVRARRDGDVGRLRGRMRDGLDAVAFWFARGQSPS